MKKLFLIALFYVSVLPAQDTIRFTNGSATPVKVNEIGETDIKYNRWDNITGPVYVVNKNEVRYIRYVNGMKDTFAVAKPKAIETPSISYETPGYVTNPPQKTTGFQQLIFVHKRLYYDHHPLSDKNLLTLIRNHPEQGVQNLLLKDYTKLSYYKNRRVIGLYMFYGGLSISVLSILSPAFGKSAGAAFLLGTTVGISGSVTAIINRNKSIGKRKDIARIYNGINQD